MEQPSFTYVPPPATGIANRDARGDLPHKGGGGVTGFAGGGIRFLSAGNLNTLN